MENKDELKRISSERIRELVSGYPNQQDFADFCGISKYSLSQYMNGVSVPGNINAAKIGKRLMIDPLWVMGFDVPKRSEKDSERIDRYADFAKKLYETGEITLLEKYRQLNLEGKKQIQKQLDMMLKDEDYITED